MLFPALKSLKVPSTSTPMVPLSFIVGLLLLYFELYGIFLFANCAYVFHYMSKAVFAFLKPPSPSDTEDITQIATLIGLRILMTLTTLTSTQFN
jgi:hypothetical protein